MTRWLAAARSAQARASNLSDKSDKTDKTDKTQAPMAEPDPKASPSLVLSELSVLSDKGLDNLASPPPLTRAAILAAVRAGKTTPGAIATAARLGATATYQELDRMKAEGVLIMKPDGVLALDNQAIAPSLDLRET